MTFPPPPDLTCPLCAEDMTLRYKNRKNSAVGRPCCGHTVCQSCVYRHIISVVEEGGAGRTECKCPLGCGREIMDPEIRCCFRRQHFHWFFHWFGALVLHLMSVLVPMRWQVLDVLSALEDNATPKTTSSHYHASWLYWRHTNAELRDLRNYERWTLTVALARMQRQDGNSDTGTRHFVQHCPAADCDHSWLVINPEYRQSKLDHERKPYYLWYSPPSPENVPSDLKHWLGTEPYDAHDGRPVSCLACRAVFCGLCRRPWNHGSRFTHKRKTCRAYRRVLGDNDEYAFAAQRANARVCPGCGRGTIRTDGCNHMTCPCGVHWCYVCETTWSVRHYGCREESRSRPAPADACVIL